MPRREPVRPWLIGEAPSSQGDRFWNLPLSGRPAEVLCKCAGIPPDEPGTRYGKWTWALYERFACRNVFKRYAEATPWSTTEARRNAERFVEKEGPLVVVLLGRKVGAAFGLSATLEWGEWVEGLIGGLPVPNLVCVPHPSGLSRIMNEQETKDLVGRALNEAVEKARDLSR